MSDSGKAVFLSYASQDSEAARRICESLRAAGVEVWFDQSGLDGGDAWDAKIRGQIKACALFMPVVSKNTQARREGYFRIEWKLAAQRMHAFADGTAFLLPVVIDETHDADALVPEEFRAVQWTRLPGGEPNAPFAQRVRLLLRDAAPAAGTQSPFPALPANRPTSEKSVAVLAFANLSEDKDNEYFSDGISEELLNVLAKVPGLKVSARTSAFYFKGRQVPIPEIAQKLGVAYVVEGSVRKAGPRVRISAQLISAADGFHLWSETFTRELQDIFAVQDEIAGLIAQNLQLRLGAAARTVEAVNPEVHRLVLEARFFWTMRTEDGFARAEQACLRALEIGPQFAPAHAALADVRALRGMHRLLNGALPGDEDFARAMIEAEAALELDPSLVEPHAAMGLVLYNQRKFAESEEQFQQAFRLNPNHVAALHWHALLLANQGQIDASQSQFERSLRFDPLSKATLHSYAFSLAGAGRYEQALAINDRALALDANVFIPMFGERAFILFALGRKDEAVEAARVVTSHPLLKPRWWEDATVIQVLRQAGLHEEATAYGEKLLVTLPAESYVRGFVLAALDRHEEALPYVERAPAPALHSVYFMPMWDPVRDDPRFHQLLAKLNCTAHYGIARETLARMLRERDTPIGDRR